jgi:hypothetical protein
LDGTRDLDALRRKARRQIPDLDVDVAEALAPLISAGVVVDAGQSARLSLRVDVAHDGPTTAMARTVSTLLAGADVAVGPDADLLVVLSTGEPDRAALADAVRCRITHLVVVVDGDAVRIGPLVIPGQTPCVGCADLHRATWDPAWLALVPQFGRNALHTVRPMGGLTQHVAAVEIVATCLEFVDARQRPGQVRTVDPDRRVRVAGQAAFHPRCACALLSVA